MSHSVQLTWTPAETDITEIAAYLIFRSVDGGEYLEYQFCAVNRDFIGSIVSIDHCTTVTVPAGATKQFFDDAPVSFVDLGLLVNHIYCYYVQAVPLGNNQSHAQGPPSAPSNVLCFSILAQATAPVLSGLVVTNDRFELDWTASTIEGSTIQGYQLFRNQNGGAFSLYQTLGNVLTYTDLGVTVGPVYGYHVVAVPVVGGNSPASNEVDLSLSVFYTSRIYPVEVIETMRATGSLLDQPQYQYAEKMKEVMAILSGTLNAGLLSYTNGLPEALKGTSVLLSGTLQLGLVSYTNGLPEAMKEVMSLQSGTLAVGLISYTHYAPEPIKTTMQLLSGTLV